MNLLIFMFESKCLGRGIEYKPKEGKDECEYETVNIQDELLNDSYEITLYSHMN